MKLQAMLLVSHASVAAIAAALMVATIPTANPLYIAMASVVSAAAMYAASLLVNLRLQAGMGTEKSVAGRAVDSGNAAATGASQYPEGKGTHRRAVGYAAAGEAIQYYSCRRDRGTKRGTQLR